MYIPEFGEFGGGDTGSSVLKLPQEFLSTVAWLPYPLEKLDPEFL